MSKECILSILKRLSEAKPSFKILRFDIRYFAVRCLIQAVEAASLIIRKPCRFDVVSHEVSAQTPATTTLAHLRGFSFPCRTAHCFFDNPVLLLLKYRRKTRGRTASRLSADISQGLFC